MRSLRSLAPLALTLLPLTAAAQSGPPQGWSLGLGGTLGTDPYVGDDFDALPFPIIQYRGERFSVGLEGATYTLYRSGPFSLDGTLGPRIFGLVFSNADELDGIDRDITGDVGLAARYDTGIAFARAAVKQEFTRQHDGQEVELAVGTRLPAGRVRLQFEAGATYQSGDLASYLWGVETGEATPDRAAYDPGEALIPFLGATAIYPLSDRLTLIGTSRLDVLPDAVADSPIVDESVTIGGFFGISYRF